MTGFRQIEKKWQERWEKEKVFESNVKKGKRKFFITVPYPYVNGAPHIGAGFTYLRGDTFARFKRMQGFNVLFSQAFHATGEPIVGVVERLRNGDEDQAEALKTQGASDKEIKNFAEKGAEFVANYWMERWIKILKSAGYSADWRRTFITAIDPAYNKFIQWQYNTLKKKDYVVQGTHPVVWCPHDQSPTGDHDRLVGEGESPIEFVVLKFKLEKTGDVFPCATLRPETVYGATNIWINPNDEYVVAKVDGEKWVVSSDAMEKLKDQLHDVEKIGEVTVKELIGKFVENPVTKNKVPILPAYFVDSSVTTGVVMSVPSHAPYDWIGLHELNDDPEFAKKLGVSRALLEKIAPIPVIKVDDMGDNPAIEVAEKMLITRQSEKEKLDEATETVYKKEFHQGVLNRNTDYAGMKVSEAKEKITSDFIEKKFATTMWEATSEVVCRCKTKCHVKILENQWFLKFSDEKWKGLVKEAISRMNFYPEIVSTQFINTVDWLKDKACARKSGLGTKLPWDEEWIVETLSDSVIYMAYYTIAHLMSKGKISAEDLSDEVFDYIFFGGKIPQRTEIDSKILEKMREEFEYFYPVDVRVSGKDLIQNHLTYFIFHHTAIWENPSMWPRGIAVNGYITLSGQKMSKRFGNVTMLKDLLERYGADVTRLNLVGANENMDDADWREENIDAFVSRIKFMQKIVKETKSAKRKTYQNSDRYIMSRLQDIIFQTTEACESTKFRSAIQSAFFESANELKWYIDRCGKLEGCNEKTLKDALSTVVSLLSPFMPHVAEELWESLGNKSFVSTSQWPRVDKKLKDENSELGESFVKKILSDVYEIKKISGMTPKKVVIIVAPQWKFDVYNVVLKNKNKDLKKILELIKDKNQETVKYVQMLQKKLAESPEKILDRQNQFSVIGEAKDFLENQLSVKIEIEDAEKSNIEKARNADVKKPAILLI